MKQALFGVALLALTAAPVMAGPTITFDEQGNGSVTGFGANPIQLQGFLSVDPVSQRNTLAYDLGKALGNVIPAPGDVVAFEPGVLSGPSDLLRFGNNGLLYVFSTLEPGETPGPADWPTTPLTTHAVFLPEIALPGGGEGLLYTPALSSPGFNPEPGYIPGGVTYRFISEPGAVPEPGAITLALLGAFGMFGYAWRGRQVVRRN
jgi:hypothetical protein